MPIISPRARLLSATALACGSLSVGATAARAACAPDPPGGAPVVTCSGTDDNGFAAPPADDLTVEVTGTVQGPTRAISFDGNSANKALDNTGNINGNVTALGNTGNVTITQRGNDQRRHHGHRQRHDRRDARSEPQLQRPRVPGGRLEHDRLERHLQPTGWC